MSLLPESLTNFVEGGREALRSVAELAVSRTSEIDSGAALMDVATEAIGLEPFVEIETTAAPELFTGAVQTHVKPAVDFDATTVSGKVADLGAFRRRQDAKMRVEQAHATPVVQSAPQLVKAPQSASFASMTNLDPVAQERLKEAQKLIDDHFALAE